MIKYDRKALSKELIFLIPCLSVYFINRNLRNRISIPFIGYLCRCHLNDFLCGGVFLSYINILMIFCKKKPCHDLWFSVLVSLAAAVFWEYAAPLFLPYSVSDFYDVIAYVLGAIFYFLLFQFSIAKGEQL